MFDRSKHDRKYRFANLAKCKADDARYYDANRERIKARVTAQRIANPAVASSRRASNQAYIQAQKVQCEHCFTTDNLEFHHVDLATKHKNVSSMAYASRTAIRTEINKCLVLCESCHRNIHRRCK